MKSSIAVFTFLFIILLSTYARNFTTVSYGYWEDGATWLGGVAPDTLIAGDTIIIKHPVIFQHDLSFSKQSLLQVDSPGGAICEHKNITVYNGARLISYGLVEADSLIVPGGSVLLNHPGSLIIINEVKMTVSGAVFKNNGSAVAVGPWFNCHLPEYQIFSGIGSAHPGNLKITVFPDPGRGIFYFSGAGLLPRSIITIKDLTGKTILTSIIPDDIFDNEVINISDARSGVYLYEYISPAGEYSSGKVVVAK